MFPNKIEERVKARDASLGEKTSAYVVTNAINLKNKFEMGLKKVTKAASISRIRS